MINWIAFNKPFMIPLKNTSENECNFFAEERARKNEHGFSFLEAVKMNIRRISIFLQTKNAQTRTFHNVVSQMPQKSDSAIFYKRKRCTTIFLNRFFLRNGGGPEGPTQAQSACPHFSEINSIKKTVVYRLRL